MRAAFSSSRSREDGEVTAAPPGGAKGGATPPSRAIIRAAQGVSTAGLTVGAVALAGVRRYDGAAAIAAIFASTSPASSLERGNNFDKIIS